jgi:CubicO group peptidase (beta-lactamase class C family)
MTPQWPARLPAVLALLLPALTMRAAETDYSAAIRELDAIAADELKRGLVSGFSIALVDDQRLVHAAGYGFADKRRAVPATRDTVYRCGSISKLFTACAVMQLAERGRLDIDQPLSKSLPSFRIVSPFADAPPVTLRHLMCHRAGLVRESPVGSYFDATGPTPAQTVASLADCVMPHPPNKVTKYSNSGVTVVGEAVAVVAGISFEKYQDEHLLRPLGMSSSAWRLNAKLKPRFARGYLPVADGMGGFREIESPHFELGTIPAGNLYTTAGDLARFVQCLFAKGGSGGREVLKPQTLEKMFTVQFTGETNGFGLGFSIGAHRGRKTVSHSGAVYGFTSSLVALPNEKIGVIVLSNDDIATGPVKRLGNAALDMMLRSKFGEPLPAPAKPVDLSAAELAAFAGEFESASYWAEIKVAGKVLAANVSGQRMTLTPVGSLKFEANGRVAHEAPVVFTAGKGGAMDSFTAMGQTFTRVDLAKAQPIPGSWRCFLGSYGPDFIPLIISERHGHLYAMTENMFDYRLTPVNQTVFQMPPGMYVDEQLVFQCDAKGRPHTAVLANMPLRRSGR